jgi:hypothetical protein
VLSSVRFEASNENVYGDDGESRWCGDISRLGLFTYVHTLSS